jgi:hypothetical protein
VKPTLVATTAIVVISLLAACGPKGGGAATAANGAAAPAAAVPDVPVALADMPRLKAGLWKSTIDTGDGKPGSLTSCVSGKSPAVQHLPPCFKQLDIKRTFQGAYVVDSTCATPGFTMTSHAVMTGDFQSTMSSSATTTTTTPEAAPKITQTHMDSRYIGPCPPGQPPDDQTTPSGGG